MSLFVYARLARGQRTTQSRARQPEAFQGASIRQSCPMTGLRLKRLHRPIRGCLIVRGPHLWRTPGN
ncbi:hypothetical protein X971_0081 [Agrobacterium tumefaciens LBA4213 (Ach5)]|nr:hypothetical protein X971_0081 [Agrobacterium tumefaciens LBA4213 (Ach5)]